MPSEELREIQAQLIRLRATARCLTCCSTLSCRARKMVLIVGYSVLHSSILHNRAVKRLAEIALLVATSEILIALSRAGSSAPPRAASCRSQTLYLLVKRLIFLLEPRDLRFWHIGVTQLIEHFADGEFVYFSHGKILTARFSRVHHNGRQ
jgi:hypothetical protein